MEEFLTYVRTSRAKIDSAVVSYRYDDLISSYIVKTNSFKSNHMIQKSSILRNHVWS